MTAPRPTKAQQELIDFLFDKKVSRTSNTVSEWIIASKRYSAFANEYKDKIRKKLRTTQPAALADLTSELCIPYLLLQDKRFELAYEPYAAGQGRGADFAVTYRKNFTFAMEITHIHSASIAATPDGEAIDRHLVDVIAAKLGQLQANMANVLLIVGPQGSALSPDLSLHLAWMREHAERGDPQFYARYKFRDAAAFFKPFERLSVLALLESNGELHLVSNARARKDLPREAHTALQRALQTDG